MSTIRIITASLRTDTGQVREHNEDFVGFWEPVNEQEQSDHGWLYIVADGVGGAEAGEVASQYATEHTIRFFIDGETKDSGGRLENAIRNANSTLRKLADERGTARAMATTMVAAVIHDDHAVLANVGDSRGYHIRDGIIRQVTKDQSLVAQLVESGTITEEEAAVHPQRNVILSSLGPTRAPRIELFDVDILDGDMLLLCSDGLTRHLSDEEIADIAVNRPLEQATTEMIDLANERGGADNISVALIHLNAAGQNDNDQNNNDAGEKQAKSTMMTQSPVQPQKMAFHSPISPARPAVRWKLWTYTLFLSMVEAILLVLVYYWLRG